VTLASAKDQPEGAAHTIQDRWRRRKATPPEETDEARDRREGAKTLPGPSGTTARRVPWEAWTGAASSAADEDVAHWPVRKLKAFLTEHGSDPARFESKRQLVAEVRRIQFEALAALPVSEGADAWIEQTLPTCLAESVKRELPDLHVQRNSTPRGARCAASTTRKRPSRAWCDLELCSRPRTHRSHPHPWQCEGPPARQV
jgi:hypothetical protein